ncbi:MAG TPA: acyl transferase [Saprospiraceae bacterium]|nr:acyl transferase [Saprospiraceae bacterium]
MNSTFEHIRSTLRERIVQVQQDDFNALALDVFRFQAEHNSLYNRYLELIGKKIQAVETVQEIPFLPIELFKTYDIQTGDWTPERIFSSSGTTGQTTSRHLLHDPDWYRMGARRAFARQYGPVENFCFLALLPSYLERNNSSLVFMAEDFISLSRYAQSGFYLYNMADLVKVLSDCVQNNIPTVLLGVSFALLDLAEAFPMPLEQVIVMETGGMKGRRAELTREQLHQVLRTAFQVQHIHSEYGMTELLSQAYSPGNGRFYPAPTMRVLAREAADPFAIRPWGQNGALNIIDLANVDTLGFIATDDLGRVAEDHSFEVTGRLDRSEIRGCNLMVE